MTEYAFDGYPRDDPRDGARLVRFTFEDLIAAEYRDVIGVGSGQATVWVDRAGVEHVDSRGEQFWRIVRLGGVEKVVGGIWSSKLPFETAVASERRHLTISGPGQMAYLARSRMAPHTYIHDVFTGQDPIGGTWLLSAQSTVFANGPYLGAMLWRVLYEAQHFRSGTYTHRHSDGLEYTDSHADDRTVSRIPDLVLGFDQFEDSNGNAWTLTAGEFSAQVGENVLGIVQRLMQSGLSVWMDPDTFTLYAWEGRPATKLGRSTDRTGAAWGANVVRFQYPTDGTTATGNVLSDLTRVVNAYLPQGPIWVGAEETFHKEAGPADALYEGYVHSTAENLTALAAMGAAQSTAREEASDVGQLPHRLGDDPTNGAYLPGEHYLLDELVRVNTGSGEFDYDEANYPVGAWRVSLAENSAEWVAHADLGASFEEARAREFTIPSTPGHTHPPNPRLCEPAQPGTDSVTRLYFSINNGVVNPTADAGWDSGSAITKQLKTSPDGTYAASPSSTTTGGDADGINVLTWRGVYGPLTAAEAAVIAAGGAVLSGQLRVKTRQGVGIDESIQNMIYQVGVRVTEGESTTIRGTAKALHGLTSSAGSTKWPPTSAPRNRTLPAAADDGTLSAVAGTAAGDYLLFELGSRNYTTAGEDSGSGMVFTSDAASDQLVDENTANDLNSWLELTLAGSGATPGDAPQDTVRQGEESAGTSTRATRCDHEHAHGLMSSDGLHYHDREDIEGEADLRFIDLADVDFTTTPPTDGQVPVWDDAEGLFVPGSAAAITVEEEDGTPTGSFDTLKFPNGSVTDNGDGSASIDPGVGGGGLTLIGEVTLASAAANMQVSSIPSTFRALLIITRGRTDAVADTDSWDLRVGNGSVDTGTNYAYTIRREGFAASSSSSVAAASIVGPILPGANGDANYFGIVRWLIYDYADTTLWKVSEFTGGQTTSDGHRTVHGVATWKSTSAIDIVSIEPGNGTNLVIGSKLSVYGIPA